MHQFKELEIWKKSRLFCSQIYALASKFPSDEKFGLTNQLRRASVSIPLNIAEGLARNLNKDFARFLKIASGSVYEIETQLLITLNLGFIKTDELDESVIELNKII